MHLRHRVPQPQYGPTVHRTVPGAPLATFDPWVRRGYLRRWGEATRRFDRDPVGALQELDALAGELVPEAPGLTEARASEDPREALPRYDTLLRRLLGFTS